MDSYSNWVFREALEIPDEATRAKLRESFAATAPTAPQASSQPLTFTTTDNTHTRTLCQSAATLFRFSALTFNTHKIHYSLPWAQEVEGHRGLVVHGPINLISILNMWRDVKGVEGRDPESIVPESISYRATSPLYADEEYKVVLEEEGQTSKINIYGPSGVVSMKADISA